MKVEFSKQIFEKYSNAKFNENLSNGSRFVPWDRTDGQTGRYEDGSSRSSQFCERA